MVAVAAAAAAAERKQWRGSGSSGGVVVVAAAEVSEDFSCVMLLSLGSPCLMASISLSFLFLSWYVDACLKKCYWGSI